MIARCPESEFLNCIIIFETQKKRESHCVVKLIAVRKRKNKRVKTNVNKKHRPPGIIDHEMDRRLFESEE